MADISLIQDDALDDCDEGVFEQGDGSSGEQVDDDSLSPLAQFQKYALSENVIDRQMVPRMLKELFKNEPVEALTNDLPEIMNLVSKLANEDETIVRTYIFEQVPNLALLALDCAEQIPALNNLLADYLLPLVVQNLGDNDNQVRKTAQSTLFVLIENGLVTRQQAELQVCPTVLALSNVESLMDYHTGTVTLMSKLAPFLGSEVTERMFLVRFLELCSNDMFYVRKVCASHFGDFCAVVGKAAYEQTLLPCYLSLCNDDIWGVRKACAEVATSVSCPCPSGKRRSVLAPVFAKLLQDQSRWVRVSAFQTLGPFISTFANPTISNLAYNSLGELVVVNNEGAEFRINPTYSENNMLSSVLYQFQERFNQMEDEQDSYSQKDSNDVVNLLGDISDSHEINIDNVALELIIGGDGAENCRQFSNEPEDDNNTNVHAINNCNEDLEQSALPENLTSKENICTELFTNILNITNADVDANLNSNIDSFDSVNNIGISGTSVLNTKNVATFLNSGNHKNESDGTCDKTTDISNESTDENNVGFLKNEHCVVNEYSKNYNVSKNLTEAVENTSTSEQYNSFNYWYVSPGLPLDELEYDVPLTSFGKAEAKPQEHFIVMEHCYSFSTPDLEKCESTKRSPISGQVDTCSNLKQCDNQEIEVVEPPQHVVPQILIDHFISMTDQNLADNTDKDLAYHCAYSLPAVALTLGRSNWYLLKDTVELLSGNIHYKVRRTVASSLHELAIILGSEMAASYLTPLFDEFIKDLDEVRIGVLKHLAHFLGLISQSKRNLYLPRLAEFLPAKNMSRANWRFRKELAEQLLDAVRLFRPSDVSKHISNIAQELLCDKVAAVRESALLLVTELVRYISNQRHLTSNLLIKLAEKFAHSTNWKRRQTFCLLCANLLMSSALDLEQFTSDVMPHLLDLSWDPVPNVRLVVGRTVSQQIATNNYFYGMDSQHYDSIHSVLRRLQSDKDCDVRHSALINKSNPVTSIISF